MKYIVILISIILSGCASSPKVEVESELYSSAYNTEGKLVSKVKMRSVVLKSDQTPSGLILKSSKATVNESGTAAYYSGLYVWPENIAEFETILTKVLTQPKSEKFRQKTKLGSGPVIIEKQIENDDIYLLVISEDGVLGFELADIKELVRLTRVLQKKSLKQ